MSHRPLTLAGGDVGLNARSADGRVRVIRLDRTGAPAKGAAWCWPHELRGVGWHLADIKKAVSALPLIVSPEVAPAAVPLLHAHHTAPAD